jgi:hypothetical protein
VKFASNADGIDTMRSAFRLSGDPGLANFV